MPETANLEPFEQTPEDSPAFTQIPSEQPSEDSPAFTPIPTSQEQLPPEARGEVNGGPLGCCFGIVFGLILSLSIAIASRLYADPLASFLHSGLSISVRIVMALVACAAAIIFGYLGWKIGRRVYREYELSPRQKQRLERLQTRRGSRSRVRR